MKRFWLFKTEPDTYSIDDLARDGRIHWEGIRNYQARNFLHDDVGVGDEVLIYHSGVPAPAVVGTAKVIRRGYPDSTAWDKSSPYFDERSTPDRPVWFMVDIKFTAKFASPVTLRAVKQASELSDMMVARKGMRLSIQPVDKKHFDKIVKTGNRRS